MARWWMVLRKLQLNKTEWPKNLKFAANYEFMLKYTKGR